MHDMHCVVLWIKEKLWQGGDHDSLAGSKRKVLSVVLCHSYAWIYDYSMIKCFSN